MPNPDPRALWVQLSGPADSVEVKVWTVSMVLVAEGSSTGLQSGWNSVAVPAGFAGAAPGLYFATLQASRGQALSLPVAPVRMLSLK